MAEWSIESLAPHHERRGFDCGVESLNDWIEKQAGQHDKRGVSRAYVLVRPGHPRVIGFYSLSSSRIDHQILPTTHSRKLSPRLEIPSVLLGRLAVDWTHQRQGLSNYLLYNAFARILLIAQHSGVFAVTVDAYDEDARNFYLHRDFIPLLDDPLHLFYPVSEIRRLNLPALIEPPPNL